MPVSQVRNVNFGPARANATGSNGVGYTLLDVTGSIAVARVTSSVYQPAPGIYGAYIAFPDGFHGQVLWDTGTSFPTASYAVDSYNVEENDPKVADTWSMVNSLTGTVQQLYNIGFGRWKIDTVTKQMLFYAPDNATLVATFNLFDANGSPTSDAVFERQKV